MCGGSATGAARCSPCSNARLGRLNGRRFHNCAPAARQKLLNLLPWAKSRPPKAVNPYTSTYATFTWWEKRALGRFAHGGSSEFLSKFMFSGCTCRRQFLRDHASSDPGLGLRLASAPPRARGCLCVRQQATLVICGRLCGVCRIKAGHAWDGLRPRMRVVSALSVFVHCRTRFCLSTLVWLGERAACRRVCHAHIRLCRRPETRDRNSDLGYSVT